MSDELYSGTVVYMDGDHYSVDEGDQPDQRLFLDPETNTYRYATGEDPSYHDRFHQKFTDIVMEDGQPGARVTPEEFERIQELLGQMRGDA